MFEALAVVVVHLISLGQVDVQAVHIALVPLVGDTGILEGFHHLGGHHCCYLFLAVGFCFPCPS